jgi:hypothetical protein
VIKANDVTLNGNGNTVTVSGGLAVDVRDLPDNNGAYVGNWRNVLVENIISNAEMRVFGPGINHVTFDHLTASGISVLGADDVTISNNTVGDIGIQVNNADNLNTIFAPLRPVITGNTVIGSAADLVEIMGAGLHPCPNLSAVIDHNVITNTRDGDPTSAWAAVRIRCATHSTFTNNTVRSTGTTLGLYLRDESDDGIYTNNTFTTHDVRALHIGAGNLDKTFPSRNVFSRNSFRTDNTYAAYLLGLGSGNRFVDNTFYSKGDTLLGYYGGYLGNTWDHNTFYADGVDTRSLGLAHDPQRLANVDSFTNNIFSYSSATAIFGFDGWVKSQYTGDYNLFYNRAGAVSFGYYGSNLASWRTATNQSDSHSLVADPLLVNPAAGDLTLQSNSPAKGAASDGTDIGARYAVTPTSSCAEQWSCGAWSECVNGSQTRTCYDANNCGTTTSCPARQQACVVNAGPVINILHPTGKRVTSGRYLVSANAKDPDGIAQLNFYVDDVLFGTDKTYRYGVYLDSRTLINGNHTLIVEGIDKLGAVSRATRLFAVRNALVVRLTNPTVLGRVTNTAILRPKLIYGGYGVVKIEYWIDRKLYTETTTAPYYADWNTRAYRNGRHRLTIRVTDAKGKRATHTIYVRVVN